jgi:type IV secretory pathway component VirB8
MKKKKTNLYTEKCFNFENIQLDAARIVTGGTRLTSHDSLYEETKWEKLKDRRNNHKLVLFFLIIFNLLYVFLNTVINMIIPLAII